MLPFLPSQNKRSYQQPLLKVVINSSTKRNSEEKMFS